MKDSEDVSTIDLLDQIAAEREQFEKEEKEGEEYSIALNVISKAMLGRLSKTDMRVLHSIIATFSSFGEKDNFPINQTELADHMLMRQPNIARSLKKLLAAQMLTKLDNDNYQLLITELFDHRKK